MTQTDLRGQHAIVTGAGRGLGAAIVTALAARGVNVTLLGRTATTLEERADAVRRASSSSSSSSVKAQALVCDVADPASVTHAFREATRTFGPAAILVNNAGQADAALVQDITLESWERLIRVNLTGTLLCTQQVLSTMTTLGAGRIINVVSTAGLKGYARVGAYVASKHGVIGLTKTLALEIARSGVTVNAICPGYVEDTDMLRAAIHNVMRATGKSEDEARAVLARQSPRGTFVTREEVAEAVVWLCSPAAAAITGQAIPVAGGEVM